MKLLTMARRWHDLKRFFTEQFTNTKVTSVMHQPLLIRAMHPNEKDEMVEVLWKAFDPDPWNMWLDENAARKGKERKTKEFHGALLDATYIDVLDDKTGIAMYQQINKRPDTYQPPVDPCDNPTTRTAPSQTPVSSNHVNEMGMPVDAVQLEINQQAPPPPYTYLSFLGKRVPHTNITTLEPHTNNTYYSGTTLNKNISSRYGVFFIDFYESIITLPPYSHPDQFIYAQTGVDPACKGRGAGGALLKHHLARKFDWAQTTGVAGEEQQDNNNITSITRTATSTVAPVLALLTSDPANMGLPQSNPTAPSLNPSQIPVLALWTSDPANVGFYEKYGLTVYSVCTVDGVDRAWWMTNGRGRI